MTMRARLAREAPVRLEPPMAGEIRLGDMRYYLVPVDADAPTAPQVSRAGDYCGRLELSGRYFAVMAVATNIETDVDVLTRREREIVSLVARGLLNKQIAANLGISEWTVATYLRRIFLKLGVETRAAMVFRCFGLLERMTESSAAGDAPIPPGSTKT